MATRGRPRGGIPYRLEQRGRIWYAVYYDANARRQRRRSTGTECREEAEEQCARWWAEKHRPVQASPDDVLIAQALAIYLDHMTGRPSAAQAAIAVDRYLAPTFAALPISGLTPSHQQTFIADMRSNGLSEGYISRVLSVLRAALKHAHKYQIVQFVPFIFDVKRTKVRDRWLTIDEVTRLVSLCTDPMMLLFIEISLMTGARPAAVLDLTWDRVDLKNKRVDFRVPGMAETNKRRTVSRIPESTQSALCKAKQRSTCDNVFARLRKNKETGKIEAVRIGSFKLQFKRLAKKAGIEGITQYTLRHTYGAVQTQKSKTLQEVSKAMGHADSRMVERHYGHLSPDYQDGVCAVVEREFSAIFAQNRKSENSDPRKTAETLVGAAWIEHATPTMSTQETAPSVVNLQEFRGRKKREQSRK